MSKQSDATPNGEAKPKAEAENASEEQSQKTGKGGKKNRLTSNGEPQPKVVVRPMATRARRKRRHYGVIVAFLLMVALPWAAITWYVEGQTVDQYASDVGFTVRQEDGGGSAGVALLGGLADFAGASSVGGGGALDSDILYEYIQSQRIVARINEKHDLWGHYSQPYDRDKLFALRPGGTIEDLQKYWNRIVKMNYDSATGLIAIEVRAFDPAYAQTIAQAIVDESQVLVNELNAAAQQDSLAASQRDVEESLDRLKVARQALVEFRTRTQIVDPDSDLRTRMGVQNSLQQQLAQALIDYDMIAGTASETDPRVVSAAKRIEVIRERLNEERSSFSTDQMSAGNENYPMLIAEYEALFVDREFAEQTYRAALAQLDTAKAAASRQSRYLAAYIQPTLPQTAEYPQRFQIVMSALLFLFLAWALATLVYYSIRDRA